MARGCMFAQWQPVQCGRHIGGDGGAGADTDASAARPACCPACCPADDPDAPGKPSVEYNHGATGQQLTVTFLAPATARGYQYMASLGAACTGLLGLGVAGLAAPASAAGGAGTCTPTVTRASPSPAPPPSAPQVLDSTRGDEVKVEPQGITAIDPDRPSEDVTFTISTDNWEPGFYKVRGSSAGHGSLCRRLRTCRRAVAGSRSAAALGRGRGRPAGLDAGRSWVPAAPPSPLPGCLVTLVGCRSLCLWATTSHWTRGCPPRPLTAPTLVRAGRLCRGRCFACGAPAWKTGRQPAALCSPAGPAAALVRSAESRLHHCPSPACPSLRPAGTPYPVSGVVLENTATDGTIVVRFIPPPVADIAQLSPAGGYR